MRVYQGTGKALSLLDAVLEPVRRGDDDALSSGSAAGLG